MNILQAAIAQNDVQGAISTNQNKGSFWTRR